MQPTETAVADQPVPDAAKFFALLLGRPELAELDDAKLAESLSTSGLLRGGTLRGGFITTPEVLQQLPRYVAMLVDQGVDAAGFDWAWSAFAEWVSRTHEEPEMEELLHARGGEALYPRLRGYLHRAPQRSPPLGTAGISHNRYLLAVPGLLRNEFAPLLGNAERLDREMRPWGLGSHGVRIASSLLVRSREDLISALVSSILDGLSDEIRHNDLHPKGWAVYAVVAALLNAVIESTVFYQPATLDMFLRSPIALVRARAAMSLWFGRGSPADVPTRAAALAPLAPAEQQLVLAQWVYELRVRANCQGQEAPVVRTERLAIFKEIAQRWASGSGAIDLRKMAALLSGPIEGCWATSTDAELLVPLETSGALSSDEALRMWRSMLVDRIQLEKADPKKKWQQFYPPADLEVTDACVAAFGRASGASKEDWIASLAKMATGTLRILQSPLSRSRQNDKWFRSIQNGLRLRLLVGRTISRTDPTASEFVALLRIHEQLLWISCSLLPDAVEVFGVLTRSVEMADAAVRSHGHASS